MNQVNIHYAKTHLSRLIQRVIKGEEIVIAKDKRAVAKLISFEPLRHKRSLGTAKGKLWCAPDFDAPLEDFDEYA